MISDKEFATFLQNALEEDIHEGDHTSLACVDADKQGKGRLLMKQSGVLAGIELAQKIITHFDNTMKVSTLQKDGTFLEPIETVLELEGSMQKMLTIERLILNCMQRMSGVATLTNQFVKVIEDYPTQIIDTRKTTPGIRFLEKWAVVIGGGANHRMGLYDMMMIKDNHISASGGIEQAILSANDYLNKNNLKLNIEIEVADFEELNKVLSIGKVNRIMLDNFSPEDLAQAIILIDKKYETEASGGINIDTVKSYAASGVDFISVGALTHQAQSLDLSLEME